MLASATGSFRLMPDWTLAVQTAIFVFVLAALGLLVFRPIRTIIERRREFTEEAVGEAGELAEQAGQLGEGRREVLETALAEAQVERERRLAEAHRDADGIIAEARRSTREIISSTAVSIETTKRSITHEMNRRAQLIADRIVERITKQ